MTIIWIKDILSFAFSPSFFQTYARIPVLSFIHIVFPRNKKNKALVSYDPLEISAKLFAYVIAEKNMYKKNKCNTHVAHNECQCSDRV